MIHFAEIRTDYIDDKNNCYVDTWRTADDWEEGRSVAYVNLTSGEVVWRTTDSEIVGNPQVILAIAGILNENNLA